MTPIEDIIKEMDEYGRQQIEIADKLENRQLDETIEKINQKEDSK